MNLPDIAAAFDLQGTVRHIAPLGHGLINDTYLVRTTQAQYVLQRINHLVFPQPERVMHNTRTVLNHLAPQTDPQARASLLPLKGSAQDYLSIDGNTWRMSTFLPGLLSLDRVETAAIAYQAARGYGIFFRQVADLLPRALQDTLPGFHDVGQRFAQLEAAIAADRCGRLAEVTQEIAAFSQWRGAVIAIYALAQRLPLRVTHNDTKISNVLLRPETFEPVAVIDLDTVMPGSVLFDVGDMIRTFVPPVDEQEAALSRVTVRHDVLEALLAGYLSEAGHLLTEAERAHLADGGKMVTFTQYTRYLADYLNGDVYYQKIAYPTQNLARAQNQLRLFEALMRA